MAIKSDEYYLKAWADRHTGPPSSPVTSTINPPKMSDSGHGSRTSVAHHHPAPKGENWRDYPQEKPNEIAQRDSVTRDVAPKGFVHGSAAHGGSQLNKQNVSSGGAIPRGGEGTGK